MSLEHTCGRLPSQRETNVTADLARLFNDDKAVVCKRVVDGYTLTKNARGMLLIVRSSGARKRWVAFFGGECAGCCWNKYTNAYITGSIDWKKDKYTKT